MTLDENCNVFGQIEDDTFIPVFDEFSKWIKEEYNYDSKNKLEQKVLDAWLEKPSTYLKYGFITSQKCSVCEYDLLGLIYSVPEELDVQIKKLVQNYLDQSSSLKRMNEEYFQQLLDVPEVFLEKNK